MYLRVERGNRTNPKRSHSRYWVLKSLNDFMEKISNHKFKSKKNILDFGCGNKPYQKIFKKIFNEYIGADIEGNEEAEVIINNDGTLPLGNETLIVFYQLKF